MAKIKKEGQVSVEVLRHFSCAFCKKWWTIGDAPDDRIKWYCPWCGTQNNHDAKKDNRK